MVYVHWKPNICTDIFFDCYYVMIIVCIFVYLHDLASPLNNWSSYRQQFTQLVDNNVDAGSLSKESSPVQQPVYHNEARNQGPDDDDYFYGYYPKRQLKKQRQRRLDFGNRRTDYLRQFTSRLSAVRKTFGMQPRINI